MRSWIKMMLYFLAIWLFIKFSPRILVKLDSYREIVKNSEQMGIDNATLFYSEEPLSFIAEKRIRERVNVIRK